jgi:environmental stress-induced protein Ves
MSWQVVRFDDVAPQPWRNGGGVTRELLAWPNAADWQVRISVADITADGPFSSFPGVDRWFAVLMGEGVWLGQPPRAVRGADDAVGFSGESAPDCRLIAGATRDLNLMLRRDRATGVMRRFAVQGTEQALFTDSTAAATATASASATALMAVFSQGGGRLREAAGEVLVLPPMSLAWRIAAAPLQASYYFAASSAQHDFELCCALSPAGALNS